MLRAKAHLIQQRLVIRCLRKQHILQAQPLPEKQHKKLCSRLMTLSAAADANTANAQPWHSWRTAGPVGLTKGMPEHITEHMHLAVYGRSQDTGQLLQSTAWHH